MLRIIVNEPEQSDTAGCNQQQITKCTRKNTDDSDNQPKQQKAPK